MVGKEKVHNCLVDKLHTTPNLVRVGIEAAFEGHTQLSILIDEADMMMIGDAIGTCVAQPINFIVVESMVC